MSKLKALKESLVINGRKPVSKLSMHLFNEEQKKVKARALRESSVVTEAADMKVRVSGVTSYSYENEEGELLDDYDGERLPSAEFTVASKKELADRIAEWANKNAYIEISGGDVDFYDNNSFSTIWAHAKYADEDNEYRSINGSIEIVQDFSFDMLESQKRRLVKESQSRSASVAQRRLQENLTRPISGMEYRVFKQGNEGMGNGKVITQGIATARKDYAIVNGEKFDYNKYAFVGTKGF